MKIIRNLIGLVALASLPFIAILAGEPSTASSSAEIGQFVPGEALVKFKSGARAESIEALLSAQSLELLEQIHGLGILRLSVPLGHELEKIEALKRYPLVEYAEPNYIAHVALIPDDTYYSAQWALAKIQAPAAWDATTGDSNVIIAVIDTGVDLDHPDLAAKMWSNPKEIPGNGLDDDGNGFIDDVRGWDFVSDDNVPQDDHGHGTHVAGIAAAETNNSIGIAGLSWGARIMAVKVLNEKGEGTYFDVAQGIKYAADQGAKIVNLSLAGSDYSLALKDAVSYAHDVMGCLLVGAVGNDSGPVEYPAKFPMVVAVAATNASDERAYFSNYGPEVDVAAPGVSIWSTFWDDSYAYKHGTSQATPHVAGLAALIWSVNPTLTQDEVESIIERAAVDLGEPGRDNYYGHGRIDVNATVGETTHYLQIRPSSLLFLVDDETDPPMRVITNPSTSSSTWKATGGADWLSITGPAGNTPSWITVSVDKGALADYGLYTSAITVTSTMANSQNSPQTVMVTLSYVPRLRRIYFPHLALTKH